MKCRRLITLAALALTACVETPSRPGPARTPPSDPRLQAPQPAMPRGARPHVTIAQPGIQDSAPARSEIPADVANTPDAVPRREPRSSSGNPTDYEAFGKVYRILDDTEGFTESGRASWYGKKFHGRKTASGEPYDMFAMTGAHKTLPIPSYVRVTNLDNGKTAVVRINDRGPFHSGRIIDLSYAAAARIGIIGDGHGEVRIEALQPEDDNATVASAAPQGPPPAPQAAASGPPPASRWLQIGAYSDPINAVATRDQLRSHGLIGVEIRDSGDGRIHRVIVGPFTTDSDAERARTWLHDAGYPAFWVKS